MINSTYISSVERVIQQQLYNYLSQNHLLAPTQHGFRPRHSTETALLSVTDGILAATDRGEISLLCLIDLSKCFDVIDHELLLDKLTLLGVETPWFAALQQQATHRVYLLLMDHDARYCHAHSQTIWASFKAPAWALSYSLFSPTICRFTPKTPAFSNTQMTPS